MKKHWGFALVLFILLCFCITTGLLSWRNADMVYTGSVVFNSREEYDDLLSFVARDGVDYRVLEAYPDTWTVPMTVEFVLVVPKNMKFPYDAVGVQEKDWLFGIAVPVGIFVLLGLLAWGRIYGVK